MQIASNDTNLAALSALSKTDAAAAKRKLAALEEQAVKTKAAAQLRPADTVELTEIKPAAPLAQVSRSAAQDAPTDAGAPAQVSSTPATPAAPAPAPVDLVASVRKSFGARVGQDGYNAALDLNGDGVINFSDLNAALSGANNSSTTGGPSPVQAPQGANAQGLNADDAGSLPQGVGEPGPSQTGGPSPVAPQTGASAQDLGADGDALPTDPNAVTGAPGAPGAPSTEIPEEPRVYTLDDIELVLGAFGAEEGDDGFSADFDFDSDGRISFGDLNELLTRLGGQPAQQTLISQLTELFGATSNDKGFNPSLDFDNDGAINFGDLNTLLARLADNSAGQQD